MGLIRTIVRVIVFDQPIFEQKKVFLKEKKNACICI